MLLKQLVNSPTTSSDRLVYDPFREPDRQDLVREVIGLANADVEGRRYILFGVNPGTVDGDGIVGISEKFSAELKKAYRLVTRLVEPTLDLAFIYDKINGKLVGALEIDGCEFGPYFVGEDFPEGLVRGQSWIREGRNLRAVERAGLVDQKGSADVEKPAVLPEQVDVLVGFNDQPDCHFMEMTIPDTSNPPFSDEEESKGKATSIGQVLKETVSTVTTQIMRLGQGVAAAPVGAAADGSETDVSEHAGKLFADAQNHYYFEEKAVKLELCIRNNGDIDIDDMTIELGFPRVPDFDIVDRIYLSPFDKRSPNEIRNLGYPEVESREDAIFVRGKIDSLAAGSTEPALGCPLRMAVGPGMRGRKLGIRFTLRGPDQRVLGKGGLKIRFGRIED